HDVPTLDADGCERVVVKLGAGDVRHLGIEQLDEVPEDAGLRLPPQAKQDEVMATEQRVDDGGHHGLLVADDTGEQRVAVPQLREQVGSELFAYAAARHGLPSGSPEFTEDVRPSRCTHARGVGGCTRGAYSLIVGRLMSRSSCGLQDRHARMLAPVVGSPVSNTAAAKES